MYKNKNERTVKFMDVSNLLEKAQVELKNREEAISKIKAALDQATLNYYVQLGAVAMLKELNEDRAGQSPASSTSRSDKEKSEDGNSTITGEESESNVIPFPSPETSGRGTDKPHGLDPNEGV